MVAVGVQFEENIYIVSEGVASQHLALFVCLITNSTELDFSVTLTPVSMTALGVFSSICITYVLMPSIFTYIECTQDIICTCVY